MKLDNLLLIVMFGLIFSFGFYIKVLGATNIPIDVEKNGFCKQYGDDWFNKRGTNLCYDRYSDEEQIFTGEEFRDYCPKHNLLSLKFNSDCFYESGSIA